MSALAGLFCFRVNISSGGSQVLRFDVFELIWLLTVLYMFESNFVFLCVK